MWKVICVKVTRNDRHKQALRNRPVWPFIDLWVGIDIIGEHNISAKYTRDNPTGLHIAPVTKRKLLLDLRFGIKLMKLVVKSLIFKDILNNNCWKIILDISKQQLIFIFNHNWRLLYNSASYVTCHKAFLIIRWWWTDFSLTSILFSFNNDI